jgi:hypothetical protein
MAQKNHGPCSICQFPIVEGELYCGYVCIGEYGHFYVIKDHEYCPEEFYRREEEIHRRYEEELAREQKTQLKLVA